MAGVPSSIIRFICHIPTGWAGISSLDMYNGATALNQSIFDDIPNGQAFLYGLQIVGQAVDSHIRR